MRKILVLGSTGMLGHTVAQYLSDEGFTIISGSRTHDFSDRKSNSIFFDAYSTNNLRNVIDLDDLDFVINCIGVIKQKTPLLNFSEVRNSIEVNSIFPFLLNDLALKHDFQVIQIATDCVFDGSRGGYSENEPHNPLDVYGKTKSLGEVESPNYLNLRTSIVGMEKGSNHSLLSWLLARTKNETVSGYANHIWNGVTTYHFAKIISGILREKEFLNGTHHLVPEGVISKYDLLRKFRQVFGREDLNISMVDAPTAIDRTLTTVNPDLNERLWKNAGYDVPPGISKMLDEYAEWLKG